MSAALPLRYDQPEAGPSRSAPQNLDPQRQAAQPRDDYAMDSQGTTEEYGDLLMGLGSDDLNDFDDVDDFGDPLDDGQEPASRIAGLSRKVEVIDDPFISGGGGFTTGKGRAIAPPSAAAIERAKRLLANIDEDSPANEPHEHQSADDIGQNKRQRLSEKYDDADHAYAELPAPDFTMSQNAGFVTGKGKAMPSPSRAAMQKAMKLMSAVDAGDDWEPTGHGTPTALPRSMPKSAFTAANAVAGPSRQTASLGGPHNGPSGFTQSSQSVEPMLQTPRLTPRLARTGSTGDARRRALAIFGEDNADALQIPSESMLPPMSATPFRPLLGGSSSTPRALPLPSPTIGRTAAFRTPLRSTTNTHNQPQASPLRSQQASNLSTPKPKPIEIKKTPATTRRVGLGLTPASRGRAKKTFTTPFMKGPQATGSPLKTSVVPRTSFLPASTLSQEKMKEPVVHIPVFDLTVPAGRKNAKDAFLHPQFHSSNELKEMGLPDEIWQLDLDNALHYQFIAHDATLLNRQHATTILKRDECQLLTQRWVDNHWCMVLWKLAGQVQAKPTLFDEKWNWGEVIAQLKYRYEREYGQAQRPIIRRIQEHDSSPSLPMVLCVAAVRWTQMPSEEEGGEPSPPRPYLELTDGWYKIVAEVDECLIRAVKRGVIRPGRKLAISGAKLESGSEGAEVLDAFDKSRLLISGNSTSLARWHTKLGLQPIPYVAGLASLSVDGGTIVLLDIIIDRLHPIAYVYTQKGSREGPWNEVEERVRADEWKAKYETESTALREKLRQRLEGIEDLVESLCSAAQDVTDPVLTTPPEDLERRFDEMLNAHDTSARIRTLPAGTLVHLASYARGRMQQEITDGEAEIEGELQTVCPTREVRDFRLARISDAREGIKEPTRTALLTIWDVKSLGEGAIKEGGRYMISNLMPARQGDWTVPKEGKGIKEICLNTRRDSRWKEVDKQVGAEEL